MRRPLPLLAAVAGIAVVAAACGGDDSTDTADSDRADRTVQIRMVDIAFEPDRVDVAAGETVRFVFTNDGDVAHDAFVGDRAAQADHEQQMRDADDDSGSGMDHEGGGEEGDGAITVEPGGTGELTYTFEEAGTVEIGCHQPGHYDAGMKIDVEAS